jgi:hypothetical protein
MERVDGVFETHLTGITRKDGRLHLARPDAEEPIVVTVRYLRPLTSRSEIVFLDEKQQEVVTVRDLNAMTGAEQELVAEALRERYHLTVIARVEDIDIRMGTRYWRVETNRGDRWFALREPGKNVTWLGENHLVLRDTAGNRFEIPDLAALDARRRRLVRRSI